MEQSTGFLGNNHLSKQVNNCVIALTGYGHNTDFEDWHSHRNSSISFLLSGTHQEDLFNKQYKRIPGNIKFIPAGEVHRCNGYTRDTKKINLEFDEQLLKQMEITETGLIGMLQTSSHFKLNLLKLYHEITDGASSITASAEMLLYALFDNKNQTINYTDRPDWVNQLEELLHDEWSATPDLNDLSARLNVHPVTISRYFPKYFSSNLSSYMRTMRVDRALALIKNTALPLTQIAYQCGFADQGHFTRSFKQVTGFLPKQFRNI